MPLHKRLEDCIRREIDEILWLVWDPLDTNDVRETRGVYSRFVDELFEQLAEGASEWTLANHLSRLEGERLGRASVHLDVARRTARRLLAVDTRSSRKLELSRSEFARRFPAFADFVATWVVESADDGGSPASHIMAFVDTAGREAVRLVLREGEELLSFEPFPRVALSSEAHRSFDEEPGVRSWLESILAPLRESSARNS